jgi:hypothetical protein
MAFLPIGTEVTKHQLLKERLLAYDSTLDEETLRDTLEGITDLQEMITAVIRSAASGRSSSRRAPLAH